MNDVMRNEVGIMMWTRSEGALLLVDIVVASTKVAERAS